MCLILFSWKSHPDYKLILAANRDEFYKRPTQQANRWEDQPNIIAGKDLQAGGTWIGITDSGRIAAITNYRDPKNIDPSAKSRGDLTLNFLNTDVSPKKYLGELRNESTQYNGFNLLVGDSNDLLVYNNVNHEIKELASGTYGLSNGFFQENWPKLEKGRDALKILIDQNKIDPSSFLEFLGNSEEAKDELLPKTGIPLEWERALSPLFIETETYGTRCSTIILQNLQGSGKFIEKTYAVPGIQKEGLVEINF